MDIELVTDPYACMVYIGDAENAGLEKAGLELNGHSLHSRTTAPRTKT